MRGGSVRFWRFTGLFLLLVIFSGAVSALEVSPQIVQKPVRVEPGEPVPILVYNGGTDVWADVILAVEGAQLVRLQDVMGPGEYAGAYVAVPLEVLLLRDQLAVSLFDGNTILDAQALPIIVDWPAYAAVVDTASTPRLYLFLDNLRSEQRVGLEVEVDIFHEGHLVFFDSYGPFSVDESERFSWSLPIPGYLLEQGSYTVSARFYEQGLLVAKTNSDFVYEGPDGSAWVLVALVLGLLAAILVLYLILDRLYYRQSLSSSLARFRR